MLVSGNCTLLVLPNKWNIAFMFMESPWKSVGNLCCLCLVISKEKYDPKPY